MNTIEAIHARRSEGHVKPDPIPRGQIEILLDAAVQAPNHYQVRPWRFIVIEGAARDRLGDALAQALHRKHPDLDEGALAKERAKPLRAPVILAVGVDKPTEARVLEIENICAAAAACQNILLAATDLGLAVHWRTGAPVSDPEVKEFLGLAADHVLIAFLYIGYPAVETERRERPGFADRTSWLS